MTPPRYLARSFNNWAMDNGGHKMAERKIKDRLTCIDGVCEVRAAGTRVRGLNITVGHEP